MWTDIVTVFRLNPLVNCKFSEVYNNIKIFSDFLCGSKNAASCWSWLFVVWLIGPCSRVRCSLVCLAAVASFSGLVIARLAATCAHRGRRVFLPVRIDGLLLYPCWVEGFSVPSGISFLCPLARRERKTLFCFSDQRGWYFWLGLAFVMLWVFRGPVGMLCVCKLNVGFSVSSDVCDSLRDCLYVLRSSFVTFLVRLVELSLFFVWDDSCDNFSFSEYRLA